MDVAYEIHKLGFVCCVLFLEFFAISARLDLQKCFVLITYASLYAPAIDSGRYSFTVEVVKSEPDPERPILIVKITSELINHSEEEIETDILDLVQNIVNGCAQRTTEYLSFIYSEIVNIDDLLSALNEARLIQMLHSRSSIIIESHAIKQNPDKYTPLTKDFLIKHLSDLKADVSDILKKIQKTYNESLDIDDEEEYYRVQSEIRERRKKFRSFDELLTSLLDAVTSYVNVNIETVAENIDTTTETVSVLSESVQVGTTSSEPESKIQDSSRLTEQAFFDWLISEGGVSDSTAKQYISNMHSIEKLYQTIFGIRSNILGAASSDNVKSMLETLVQKSGYIDANDRRHNSFSISLSKFAQFAGISIDGIQLPSERKTYQSPISTVPYVIKTVDFDNPHNCMHCKPCSFILNDLKYSVGGWHELYTQFLILLYADSAYNKILIGLNGKSLYGRKIDFADKTLVQELRKPIEISTDFFAEGNLSAISIINYIKRLMELCSIDNEHMIIKYSTQEKDDDPILPDSSDNDDTKGVRQLAKSSPSTSFQETIPAPITFNPDTTKPFALKNAVIEILLSESPEITKFRERKGGISSKDIRELIKEYYGKTIGLFDISKLLVRDKTFQPDDKGWRILNKATISNEEAKPNQTEHDTPEKTEPAAVEIESIQFNHTPATHKAQLTNTEIAKVNENATEDLTIGAILEVIKENSDNLQYEDGFGVYEVKTLLSHKGINNTSEEQIEALMSECSELQEVEDGYYLLSEDDSEHNAIAEPTVITENKSEYVDLKVSDTISAEVREITADANCFVLRLNGNIIRAYDYSDALNKVCEFAINCKPFRMARIAGQAIRIHGISVFYRVAVPLDGYNKLSNGLQVITITTLSDLQMITAAVQKYCQIDDDMIAIISK